MPQPLLKNPFVVEWTQTAKSNLQNVIDSLKKVFGKLRKSRPINRKFADHGDEASPSNVEKIDSADKTAAQQEFELKRYFVFGVSNVIRQLERKQLRAAIFDRNILKQAAISYHVGTLCVNSGAVCGCVENLSAELSPILAIKSTMAVGVKKFDDSDANERILQVIDVIELNLNRVVVKTTNDEVQPKKKVRKQNVPFYVPPTIAALSTSIKRKKPNLKDVSNKKAKKLQKNK